VVNYRLRPFRRRDLTVNKTLLLIVRLKPLRCPTHDAHSIARDQ